MQSSWELQLLMNDGDHEVNADGDPDLRFHRVGACSVIVLDAQMAFGEHSLHLFL